MVKCRSGLVLVVAILVSSGSVTSSSTSPDSRRKRADYSPLSATLNKIWQSALMENLPLMSQLAGRILPNLSYNFLASPAQALDQMTKGKVGDLIDSDLMLSVMADDIQQQSIKDKIMQIIADSALEMDCDQLNSNDDSATENVVALLTKFELLKMNRQPDCFTDNGRYSGADFENGTIIEGLANSIQDCQNSCIDEDDCEYFTYFKEDHPEVQKRKVCRLLRISGNLQSLAGHKSGPKFCEGIFYPRVFAKRLRDFVVVLYPGYRAVQCHMMEVRLESKKNIDRMYFLRSEETQGFYSSLDNYKCEVCSSRLDCESSEVVLDIKINKFFDHLKSVSRNMSELLKPMEDPGTFTDDEYLQALQNNVSDSIKAVYFRELKTLILSDMDCEMEEEGTASSDIFEPPSTKNMGDASETQKSEAMTTLSDTEVDISTTTVSVIAHNSEEKTEDSSEDVANTREKTEEDVVSTSQITTTTLMPAKISVEPSTTSVAIEEAEIESVSSTTTIVVTTTETTESASSTTTSTTTTTEESSVEEMSEDDNETELASIEETVLPLCSEVSKPSQLGSGLLSQFGISISTTATPCREDPTTTSTTTTTTPPPATTTQTTAGVLYQQLANKFGF